MKVKTNLKAGYYSFYSYRGSTSGGVVLNRCETVRK